MHILHFTCIQHECDKNVKKIQPAMLTATMYAQSHLDISMQIQTTSLVNYWILNLEMNVVETFSTDPGKFWPEMLLDVGESHWFPAAHTLDLIPLRLGGCVAPRIFKLGVFDSWLEVCVQFCGGGNLSFSSGVWSLTRISHMHSNYVL